MRPSNVCFVIAGTILLMHQMLFELFGGHETISHNPMAGIPSTLCYALAAAAGLIGWRMRKSEESIK
jgi:hypothetical protein